MKLSPSGREPSADELLDFLLLFGKQYLSSGGPSSRLEECIYQLGNHFHQHSEAFATPTGIFITSRPRNQHSEHKTALTRIRASATDLSKICDLERIYNDVLIDKLTIFTATEILRNAIMVRPIYRFWQTGLVAFIAGLAVSYGSYERSTAAVVSGLITLLVWALTSSLRNRLVSNPIFTDFTGSFLTLILAALAHMFIAPISIEAYSLGGLVLLVPGLAFTTAIAELADQNLVSGTAKFMQACLSLLAMGLAYMLFQELARSMDLRTLLLPAHKPKQSLLISFLAVICVASSFGVIFKVPPKALISATITGILGWCVLHSLAGTSIAVTAPYFGAFAVGLASLGFGRIFKLPSQVYSVPGIVAMLPGMVALSGFQYFAAGEQETGIAYSFQVALTAVSIVFGLISARVPFSLANRHSSAQGI